ncbi:MAG TPA: adenylyltransferase/cytidyltransferase family protein, partial [Longimicrobiales bacterium]
MNVGLFGGTFDPPHIGHLVAAQDACSALSLDRFLFIPAAVPPHKRGRAISSPDVRCDMLRAALAGNSTFEICELELR